MVQVHVINHQKARLRRKTLGVYENGDSFMIFRPKFFITFVILHLHQRIKESWRLKVMKLIKLVNLMYEKSTKINPSRIPFHRLYPISCQACDEVNGTQTFFSELGPAWPRLPADGAAVFHSVAFYSISSYQMECHKNTLKKNELPSLRNVRLLLELPSQSR